MIKFLSRRRKLAGFFVFEIFSHSNSSLKKSKCDKNSSIDKNFLLYFVTLSMFM